MATQALSDFSGALAVVLGPDVIRQMNRKATTLGLLNKAAGAGPTCAWDVSFSGATAGTYTEGADVSAADLQVDTKNQASLSWGYYRSAFGISTLAKAVAASSSTSPEDIADMVRFDAMGSASKLASVINTAIFSGSGSGSVIGLDSALAASGTYAGLSKATYSEWGGNVLANGGSARALTKSLLDELEQTIYDACGEAPDIIVTTSAIARKYESLFDSMTRQVIVAPGELSAARTGGNPGPTWRPEEGETGLTYKGRQVYRDKDCTAGHLYMLNSDYARVRFVPMPLDPEFANAVRSMGLTDLMDPVNLAAHFSALGKLGSSDRFLLELFPQLEIKAVNAHGFIDDISES